MNERKNNYEKQVVAARADFLKWDQPKMIERFSLENDDDFIFIDFFGDKHRINRSTGEVCSESRAAGFNAVLTIYDMLCYSKDGARLSGQWQTLKNLSPHSNFGGAGKDMYLPAAKRFLGKLNELRAACEALDGEPTTKADVGFVFKAFPWLPIVFQFWDGDEEFEPRINFLFDSKTLDFIHFETAWYVAGYLLDLIEENI